ncbi:flavin-containing monooxygenase [Parablastomonas sp. CN1-191]|uniref:flavin-containing monooxygenase n=1 Tax=Parablastomonas sp. CN1-191 TaxID=3400908 RepID=UPI003BF8F873
MTNQAVPDPQTERVDVLIVGAGISGIGMAAHLVAACPGKNFMILERRERLGGTWDLFRYPGIRSDSDMHTLGFDFEPWTDETAIAGGPTILSYLARVADTRDLRRRIRFGLTVRRADWDPAAARWRVEAEDERGAVRRFEAGWLYLGSGYYDYDRPHDAAIPGLQSFGGQVVHPQFWPETLDYAGKRVVVIGSGATAVTLVPALVKGGAAKVTMLQRTPTWIGSRPARDAFANALRKVLPGKLAYRLTRAKNVLLQDYFFRLAKRKPKKVAEALTKRTRAALGAYYDAEAFTPPYDPWDQRLCLVPDGDLFEAIKAGTADIVTDRIEAVDETGIALASGRHLDADVIVTATGLTLAAMGGIAVSLDGTPVNFAERWWYKACMFSNVPNFAAVFGYLNASWTLRADLVAGFVCRVIAQMDRDGAQVATPVLADDAALEEEDVFDFSSGYLQRGKHLLPRSATTGPWQLTQDYRRDRKTMKRDAIVDGVLAFTRVDRSSDKPAAAA